MISGNFNLEFSQMQVMKRHHIINDNEHHGCTFNYSLVSHSCVVIKIWVNIVQKIKTHGCFDIYKGSCINLDYMVEEAYSKQWKLSKMELFAKIVNGFQPLTSLAKRSIFYI